MKVEDEWDRDPEAIDLEDLLFVTYDPQKITKEQLLETVKQAGFEPEVKEEQ